VKLPY
jgi:hypothetical protein